VTITIDVLAMANHGCRHNGRAPVFDVRLAGSGADKFRPFLAFPEAEHDVPELLIVPAQGFSKSPTLDQRLAAPDIPAAKAMLMKAARQGAEIAGSCTGTVLLAHAGLLDGRKATTAWWLASTFRQRFPAVDLGADDLVVRDGAFTTAGAAMAQMDLMVGLVARHAGREVAEYCTRRMVLDERRSQAPYMAVGLLASSDQTVAKVTEWARPRLDADLSVGELASAVGQSQRTFARRMQRATGMSPIQFLQQLRMERAVELLESTDLPFDAVAYRVGYQDPSTLRSIIRRRLGISPRELRLKARPRAA